MIFHEDDNTKRRAIQVETPPDILGALASKVVLGNPR